MLQRLCSFFKQQSKQGNLHIWALLWCRHSISRMSQLKFSWKPPRTFAFAFTKSTSVPIRFLFVELCVCRYFCCNSALNGSSPPRFKGSALWLTLAQLQFVAICIWCLKFPIQFRIRSGCVGEWRWSLVLSIGTWNYYALLCALILLFNVDRKFKAARRNMRCECQSRTSRLTLFFARSLCLGLQSSLF